MASALGAVVLERLSAAVPDLPLTTWVPLIMVTGVLYIVADTTKREWLRYLLKPGTMALIIAMCASGRPSAQCLESNFHGSRDEQLLYHQTIILGLLFSVLGDIFLMLRSQQFVAGLASFLVAHLIYIQAFSQPDVQPPLNAAVPLAVVGVVMLAVLWRNLKEMKVPVIFYVLAIMAMLWFAIGRYLETLPADQDPWQLDVSRPCAGPLLATLGAGLFVVSDSVLALNRFNGHFRGAHAIVMVTYYSAQLLIALSTFS